MRKKLFLLPASSLSPERYSILSRGPTQRLQAISMHGCFQQVKQSILSSVRLSTSLELDLALSSAKTLIVVSSSELRASRQVNV